MVIEWSFLRSRVARRVFLLFVVSALVPILTLALLSVTQVERLLTEQGYAKLGSAGKAYVMSVYERLLLVESMLGGTPPSALAGRELQPLHGVRALGWMGRNGSFKAVAGPVQAAPELSVAQVRRLASGKSLLLVDRVNGTSRVRLWVPHGMGATERAAPREAGAWVAELAPDYLWGDAGNLPYAIDVCVVDAGPDPVYCSAAMPADQLAQASAQGMKSVGRLAWQTDGGRYIAAYWGLYMRERFDSNGWVVVARQPLSEALLPALTFRSTFAAALALALLTVALLSVTQIRRTLVPIEQLANGTRRIARNDFSVRVDIQRRDEFGDLAQAFNGMADRLGRQFQALTALSEVDRAILSTMDVERVLKTVLVRMVGIVPFDVAAIAVLERDNPDLAQLTLQTADDAELPGAVRSQCTAAERERLVAHAGGVWMDAAEASFLGPLAGQGAVRCFVLPIVWKGALSGMVILGYRSEADALTEEQGGHARDFADRVAVALSTAWREEQLHYQAHFDALTKLPNRLSFQLRLARELTRAQRAGERVALLFIDLDHFKNVNDSLGHGAGDDLLIGAAERLVSAVRPTDFVSRLGGDEFTVILSQLENPREAGVSADRVVGALSQPFVIEGHEIYISASIGIALYPEDGESAETLLRNADTAMYRAKAAGRGCSVFFEERMNREAQARVTLEREMRRALERGEFILHYQPQFDAGTGAFSGAEALVRWKHPERGLLPPAEFIGLAEDTGLIEPLGAWVLREACSQYQRWKAAGIQVERLAVNVSVRQFKQASFAESVAAIVRESDMPPLGLELEITESLLIDQSGKVERTLRELEQLGVRLALDDFGTGYSSMAYLRRFPVDVVKIDRAFVKDLGVENDAEAITGAIIAMAHALGKKVIAEGVETEAQLDFLRRYGCDHVQGFYYCKALPDASFTAFLEQHRADEGE